MLDLAIRAAREAGAVLQARYRQDHAVRVKGFRDITTEADMEAEAVSLEIIRQGCPESRFISEESNFERLDYGDAPTWFVDPLDGTTNYARGLPMFSVSVAMAVDGLVKVGVVYAPGAQQLFGAARGEGAFLVCGDDDNAREPLTVSDTNDLSQAVVLLDWPRDQALRETSLRFLSRLALEVDTVRSTGSAALGLCYTAAGWADAYFQYTLGPWDVAAGMLIVHEAGGHTTDLHGDTSSLFKGDWLATNGRLHARVLGLDPYSESVG